MIRLLQKNTKKQEEYRIDSSYFAIPEGIKE